MIEPLLSLAGIGKSFFGVAALTDITLTIGKGRVLGLVGQNGAGKSTLMNVVGGVVQPDTGTMTLAGAPYAPADPRAADAAGIAFIHQELNLFTSLTIAENIFVSAFPRGRGGLIDKGATRRRTAELLNAVGLDAPPETPVERLSPGERQLVEVAKALQLNAQLVIFDEPTTSLTARETARLFALIERLKNAGTTIVYISHVLADVQALADDIAVMRDGRLVANEQRADLPTGRMINLMIGRDIDQLYPDRTPREPGEELLAVEHLTTRGIVRDISLRLRRGEVVGFFGLMGSGRTELCRMLFGLESYDSGTVSILGRAHDRLDARTAIGARMAFLTENRREEGLMMNMPIADNVALAALPAFGRGVLGWISDRLLLTRASELTAALRLKSGPIGTQVAKTLSGGNQQKVVIAKWLMADPAIIILDEPTRGIDVEAKYEIYTMIDRLAAEGCGVLLVSSEIEETMAMSDRLLVMSRGEIVAEWTRPSFDKEAILRAAFREEEAA